MKRFCVYLFVMFGVILTSCDSNNKVKEKRKVAEEELVEVKDGVYTEWYPGKKQIKYRGGQDEKNLRHGVWTFYSESGMELSVTMYEHGLRMGHTVVKYPNGMLHYRGEYFNDKTVGVWTTYDAKGNLISEKDFGYPKP
jgi:antitoxin component YwqK of YwqJK toxin-antitoxin module